MAAFFDGDLQALPAHIFIAPVDEYLPLTPEAFETSLQELVKPSQFLLGFDEDAASILEEGLHGGIYNKVFCLWEHRTLGGALQLDKVDIDGSDDVVTEEADEVAVATHAVYHLRMYVLREDLIGLGFGSGLVDTMVCWLKAYLDGGDYIAFDIHTKNRPSLSCVTRVAESHGCYVQPYGVWVMIWKGDDDEDDGTWQEDEKDDRFKWVLDREEEPSGDALVRYVMGREGTDIDKDYARWVEEAEARKNEDEDDWGGDGGDGDDEGGDDNDDEAGGGLGGEGSEQGSGEQGSGEQGGDYMEEEEDEFGNDDNGGGGFGADGGEADAEADDNAMAMEEDADFTASTFWRGAASAGLQPFASAVPATKPPQPETRSIIPIPTPTPIAQSLMPMPELPSLKFGRPKKRKKVLQGIVKVRCEAAQARPDAAGGNDLDCSR
jgi:hypothetical protein